MGERRQESSESVVCCYAGCVEAGDGVEEMMVGGGVVEAGWREGGHFGDVGDIGVWVTSSEGWDVEKVCTLHVLIHTPR